MVPPAGGGDPVEQMVPRNQQELDNIIQIVQNAIGYDPVRGDQVTINQLGFRHQSQFDEERQRLDEAEQREFWYNVAQKVLLVISQS